MALPKALENLIQAFSKLPGIGHKTAEKFVFHLLKQPASELETLGHNLLNIKEQIKLCPACFNFSETLPCSICTDPRRAKNLLCVLADASDLLALEKTNEYAGKYFVLGGTVNQLEGIGPEQLRFRELLKYIQDHPELKEIILAFDPDLEGESTVMYLTKILKPLNLTVTRLARGLPMGADLEYADAITLSNALSGRREI